MKKILLAVSFFFGVFFGVVSTAAADSGWGNRDRPRIYAVRAGCDRLDVDAGGDEKIDQDETVRLDGSVDGDYDELDWDCTGGDLSNDEILRPTFDPPGYYDGDKKTYTCTLTASNDCDKDSDSMKITVNYERESSKFRVILRAKPQSACAPANDVDLTADLEDYTRGDYEYTYRFDCDDDGDWEKTVTTEDTEYTAKDLCDYRNSGSYTARVRVEGRDRTVADTYLIHANDCNGGGTAAKKTGQVSITKMVRNISRNAAYSGMAAAAPSEVVSYQIVLAGVAGTSNNVFVRDSLPVGLIDAGNLRVDGVAFAGSLDSGISIGTLAAGQTKVITYNAVVAQKTSFNFGNTALTNIATVTAGNSSANSYTTVNVYRSAVAGATAIPTGVGGKAGVLPETVVIFALALGGVVLAAKKWILGRISRNIR